MASEQFEGHIGILADEGCGLVFRPNDIDADDFGNGQYLVDVAESLVPKAPRVPQSDKSSNQVRRIFCAGSDKQIEVEIVCRAISAGSDRARDRDALRERADADQIPGEVERNTHGLSVQNTIARDAAP